MRTSPTGWLGAAAAVVVTLAAASGCVAEAPAPQRPPSEETGTTPPAPVAEGPATFVDIVWRVAESPQVPTGQLYVFLSTGTLVIASASGTPTLGTWTAQDGQLATMVEEGVTYPIEVLSLDARQFRIRSLNPGQPVELTLERATPAQ